MKTMKKRTFEQIQISKAIYRKYADKYLQVDNPSNQRVSRMLAYTAALTKAINVASKRSDN